VHGQKHAANHVAKQLLFLIIGALVVVVVVLSYYRYQD
jgi:predicted nucleic acid-binding Zn ribbon protein